MVRLYWSVVLAVTSSGIALGSMTQRIRVPDDGRGTCFWSLQPLIGKCLRVGQP
jgi:hypothetical protein